MSVVGVAVSFNASVLPSVTTLGTYDVVTLTAEVSEWFPALSVTFVFTWYSVPAFKLLNMWVFSVSVTHSPQSDAFASFIAYWIVLIPDFPYAGAIIVASPSSWFNVTSTLLDAGATTFAVGAEVVGTILSIFVMFNNATADVWAPSQSLAYAIPFAVNVTSLTSSYPDVGDVVLIWIV